tara:strand:- start:21598 stop:23616 length:2019 start_codon:yes stop_codon:yes gene_type:complete
MKISYRPEIDGLRAIAVISVIIYHAKISIEGIEFLKGGFIGVDIFFVISGYLITSIILKELFDTETFSFKYFYERRIRRLLPALLLVMLVSFPFAWMFLLPSSFIDFSKSILYSLGFSSNFYFWFSGQQYGAESALFKPFLHTWSLSVEEQFYIIFPIFLLFSYKYFRKYITFILILGFIISIFLAEWGSRNYPSFNFYVLPTRGWELLAGSILAYIEITLGRKNRFSILNHILPIFGLLLIGYSILFFNEDMFHPSFFTLIPVIGVCLIIWFSNKDALANKILSSSLFVKIGLISYSLYLWHYPIFAFARVTEFTEDSLTKKIFLIIISLILSIISYLIIEKPARNKKFRFKIIFLNIIFFSGLVIILNYLILSKIPNYFEENVVTNFRDNLKDTNCELTNENFLKCSLNDRENYQKIFLMGDSHIGSIRTDLKNELIKKDFEVNVIANDLCMFFREFNLVNNKTNRINDCKYYNLVEKIFTKKKSIFIIGGRFQMHMHESYFDNTEGGVEDGDFNARYISTGKYDSLENSFKNLFQKILNPSSKNQIILIYPIPEVGWNVRQKLINSSPRKFSLDKNHYIPREWITTSFQVYKDRTKSSFDLLDSIKGDNVYRIYPHKLFCNTIVKERCITHNDKNIFYADDNHPSLEGAKMINGLIIDQIEKINLKTKY